MDLNHLLCDNCLVYGSNNKPLSRGRVINSGNSLQIMLTNPNLKSVHVRVMVDFYDKAKGVMRCLCEIQIHPNYQIGGGEPWAAECEIIEVSKVIQRQKSQRVSTNISAMFTFENGMLFSGVIKNISVGGLFVNTNKAMINGTKFHFDFTFSGTLCVLHCMVLHGHNLGKIYGYGCQFYGISDEATKALRQFVHDKDMEFREKNRKLKR